MAEAGHLLSNRRPETADRFGGLEATFDSVTTSHLERLGVGPGARCL
jgi:hypothetical protein